MPDNPEFVQGLNHEFDWLFCFIDRHGLAQSEYYHKGSVVRGMWLTDITFIPGENIMGREQKSNKEAKKKSLLTPKEKKEAKKIKKTSMKQGLHG